MNYKTARKQLEYFSRFGMRPGLERIRLLLKSLDDPQNGLKVVLVGGTNGKGSVCAFLSSILTRAGYKVGRYTSPHLHDYPERITVNNCNIPRRTFGRLFSLVNRKAQRMREQPTVFEILTAMAILYFKQQAVDLAVCEVGLGGSFDATNILHPLFSIITNVELEHTEVLGNTCTKIARDKAGIIRPAGYLITGDEKTAVLKVLRAACKEVGAGFIQVKSNRKAAGSGTLQPAHTFCQSSPWPAYQYQNLRVVDAALRLLGRLGYPVSVRARREGIKKTYWPARFEILSRKPRIIIDGAHNPAGVAALIAALRQYPYPRPAVLIFGAIKGKQVAKMLPPLTQHFDAVFLTGFKYATALSPREILAQCKTVKIAKMFSSPRLALAAARKSKFKTVLICGSLYMLGELTSRLPV